MTICSAAGNPSHRASTSLPFASPEAIAQTYWHSGDHKSYWGSNTMACDIWSLGVVVHHAAMGKLPFPEFDCTFMMLVQHHQHLGITVEERSEFERKDLAFPRFERMFSPIVIKGNSAGSVWSMVAVRAGERPHDAVELGRRLNLCSGAAEEGSPLGCRNSVLTPRTGRLQRRAVERGEL